MDMTRKEKDLYNNLVTIKEKADYLRMLNLQKIRNEQIEYSISVLKQSGYNVAIHTVKKSIRKSKPDSIDHVQVNSKPTLITSIKQWFRKFLNALGSSR